MPSVLLSLLLASSAVADTKLVVLPFNVPETLASAVDARSLDEAAMAALHNAGDFSVIGLSDLETVMDFEAQKDLLNCESATCLAEIGAAFGAEYLVELRLGVAGVRWMLTGKLLHVGGAPEVRARMLHPVSQNASAVVDALPLALRKLASDGGFAVKSVSEVAFSPVRLTRAPSAATNIGTANPSSLAAINLKAEQLLESVLETEESDTATAAEKAAGWCRLAQLKPNNIYASQAQTACDEWKEFIARGTASEAQFRKDSEIVAGYIKLERKRIDQKRAVLEAYLTAYGDRDAPEVRWAKRYRDLLATGRAADCPSGKYGLIGCDPLEYESLGLTLELVKPGLVVVVASSCELKPGDAIRSVGSRKLETPQEFQEALKNAIRRRARHVRVYVDAAEGREQRIVGIR